MALMSEAEALSLRTSSVIDDLAMQEVRATGVGYAVAVERVLAREAHLRAGLAGDVATFTELSARARATRMALPAGGTHERRFRRAGPPRALSSRRIADRSELLPGEVACMRLAPDGCGGGLFAERIG